MFSANSSQVSNDAVYVEDVFSTWLYTGNGSTQTITNGIDLSTKGGLVWIKNRISTFGNHLLSDSARGLGTTVYKTLSSNLTDAQNTTTNDGVSAFNANGFSVTGSSTAANDGGSTYASWTFRKQPKFFDVVTYTGDGTAGRTVAHSLGSVPGCMIVKCTSTTGQWVVYHRVLGNTSRLYLNSTGGSGVDSGNWNNTDPTSTEFTLGNSSGVNASTRTYVAYLFAHDAGGFGLTGTDNVISCGSYTGNGSATGPVVTLGYEPQWVLIKNASDVGNWVMSDNMRNWSVTNAALLYANLSNAEATNTNTKPLATGFQPNDTSSSVNTSGATYIYIAIRRGPMKVPTSGTSVFSPVAYTGNATDTTRSAGFPVDMLAILRRSNPFGDGDGNPRFMDRLRGGNSTSLISSSSSAEETSTNNTLYLDNSVGFKTTANNPGAPTGYYFNVSTNPYIAECFRRAPSFFDEVCYTGTGSATAVSHNLQAVPQLIITKSRSAVEGWPTVALSSGTSYYSLSLNTTGTGGSPTNLSAYISSTSITPYAFSNATSGVTYVAYLFATCAGVSKVGSYTGTGTTKQVDCGFTGGARFVLIKRADSSGDWYVWDTARGIVAGNDPYLLLNSTAAEVTTTDYIDPYSAGFEISSTAPAAINASGGTFIFLAIA